MEHQQHQQQQQHQPQNHNQPTANGTALTNSNKNNKNLGNNIKHYHNERSSSQLGGISKSSTLAHSASTENLYTKYNSHMNNAYSKQITSQSTESLNTAHVFDSTLRKSPEGKDNDTLITEYGRTMVDSGGNMPPATINHQHNALMGGHKKLDNGISTENLSTSSDNGKMNVQVTVLVGK